MICRHFFISSAVEIEEKFNAVGKGHGKLSAVIWTTTPWTMPSNRAIKR
jgi:isoleucyl-tRNA synthetase